MLGQTNIFICNNNIGIICKFNKHQAITFQSKLTDQPYKSKLNTLWHQNDRQVRLENESLENEWE